MVVASGDLQFLQVPEQEEIKRAPSRQTLLPSAQTRWVITTPVGPIVATTP
jgi:hypothetical protein